MSPFSSRGVGWVALGVGVLVFAVYALTAAPSIYWLDSGEFVAASWGLGIAHPPGHPLAALVGRLLTLLPLGTIAFRVNLASAVAGAGAAALLVLISHRLLVGFRPTALSEDRHRRARLLLAGVAGLSGALSYAFWFQAIRAEVYALNVALLILAVHLMLCWLAQQDRRHALAAAFVLGLALCNHHLLIVLALPAFLALIMRSSRTRRLLLPFALMTSVGLATMVYLPLRAAQTPEVNWGAPTTMDRFFWVVSAKAFQKSVDRAQHASLRERAASGMYGAMTSLTPFGVISALGGLYFLWRRRATRGPALFFSVLIAGNLAAPLLIGMDPLNADAHGYLAPTVAVLCLCLAALLGMWIEAFGKQRVVVAAILLLGGALPLAQGIMHGRTCNLRDFWAAEETARAILDRPPGSVVSTSYFETTFNAWALRSAFDHRPDLALFDWHFLSHPGYGQTVRRREPAIVPLLDGGLERGRWPVGTLAQLATQRAVYIEVDGDLPDAVTATLYPAGLLARVGRDTPGAFSDHVRRIAVWHNALDGADDLQTHRTQLYVHYRLADFACRRHLTAVGQFHFRQAIARAPHDTQLAALAQQCGYTAL